MRIRFGTGFATSILAIAVPGTATSAADSSLTILEPSSHWQLDYGEERCRLGAVEEQDDRERPPHDRLVLRADRERGRLLGRGRGRRGSAGKLKRRRFVTDKHLSAPATGRFGINFPNLTF